MSWLFSQALVEEYSAANNLDGEPFVQWNVTPMPQGFLLGAKTMASLNRSLSGQMYAPSTENLGEELLMSFRAAFHAKTLAQLERVQESKVNEAVYGLSSPALLARLCPNTSMWKIPQCSLFADLEQSLEIWPRWGSMQNGVCYQRTMLMPPISEKESGLWPTPAETEGMGGGSAVSGMKALNREKRPSGCHRTLHLRDAVKMWPTPRAKESGDYLNVNRDKNGVSRDIALTLSGAAKMYPTPTASASKGSSPASLVRKNGKSRVKDRLDHAIMHSDGGQLNPTWVEWLMGWPLGWTDLKPLAMDKFLEWQQQHSSCSEIETNKAAA